MSAVKSAPHYCWYLSSYISRWAEIPPLYHWYLHNGLQQEENKLCKLRAFCLEDKGFLMTQKCPRGRAAKSGISNNNCVDLSRKARLSTIERDLEIETRLVYFDAFKKQHNISSHPFLTPAQLEVAEGREAHLPGVPKWGKFGETPWHQWGTLNSRVSREAVWAPNYSRQAYWSRVGGRTKPGHLRPPTLDRNFPRE